MNIEDRLMADLRDAMRVGDVERREAIRMLRAAVKNEQIERGRPLTDDEAQAVAARMAKRHRESIEQFQHGGRLDLVAREEAQLAAIGPYLPRLMSREQLVEEIKALMSEIGASGPRAQGQVMAALSERLRGKADLREASGIVRELLEARQS